MSRPARALSLLEALGFQPDLSLEAGGSLSVLPIDSDRMSSLVTYWRNLSPGLRPGLRGLAVSGGGERRLRVLLDLGGDGPFLCLDGQLPAGGAELPDFRAVWPYCGWWQDELVSFHGVKFAGEAAGRVTWRQA